MPNAHKAGYLPISLVASLLLHALIISLQFGDSGSGLPWLGLAWDERRASVPSIQAILIGPAPAQIAAAEPVRGSNGPRAEKGPEMVAPPSATVQTAADANQPTISLLQATDLSPDVREPDRPAAVAEEKSKAVVPERETAVLSTDKDSSWNVPVAPKAEDEAVRDEPAAPEEQRKEDVLLQQQVVAAEQLERAAEAKASQEALERKEVEEQAQIEQARIEQARIEQARIEAETLQQAAAAKASQEAMERKRVEEQARLEQARIEAEKLQQAAAAAQEAMERARAAELAHARQEAPEGGGQDRAGRQEPQGADLARRALEQARGNLLGPPANIPSEPDRRRRAGVLGADPRNIQLAFYGEGWRQKVERIGSLNYPRVSKDRFYEPLVVTVSINSDGTLAGMRIDKSSGYKDMDEAVRRIVEMSAPFSAFPPDLKRNYDVVDITRTWTFDERPRMISQ